jgi:serine/threonine-protein kinase
MIGRTLGHYRIDAELGAGGMGRVYRARDTKLQRDVALKVITRSPLDDSARARLLQEARAASALNHPHICTIHEVGEMDGQTFIVMEHVEGRPLSRIVPSGGLSIEEVLRYGVQIADALAHAHGRGIVHRDLKSANVVVTPDGRAKVLDFGLATRRDDAVAGPSLDEVTRSRTSLDEAGVISGTLPYLAPELLRGAPADARSDLWALGVILHELASGSLPFTGQTGFELAAAILREPAATLHPRVPAPVRRIIQRCLVKEPAQRYQQASEVRAALEILQSEVAVQPAALAPSIAVLPFMDLSPQKDQEYFCDGISEELINAFTKVEGLQVSSRTSSFQFKGATQDIPRIGAQLKVAMVIEGSVRKAGDRLRITAQLIDVTSGFHLWSDRYDREMKDVFAIQDEIALAVVDALRLKILGPGRPLVKRTTTNLEAYDLYLAGRYHWNKGTIDEVQKGTECFNQAITKDPSYAAAYAALAGCYAALCGWGVVPDETLQPARAAAAKALELDETLADAHTALAILRAWHDFDCWDAERHFKRALQLNPHDANAHLFYGSLLGSTGRLDEGLAEMKRSVELEPQAPLFALGLGAAIYYRGEYDQALEVLQHALELDPTSPRVHYYLGCAYIGKGMLPEAVAVLQKVSEVAGTDKRVIGMLGHCYGLMGRTGEARELLGDLQQLSKPGDLASFSIALIYLGLGEPDRVFEWLDQAYAERASPLRHLKVDPLFDNIRSDRRFGVLLKRLGLEV